MTTTVTRKYYLVGCKIFTITSARKAIQYAQYLSREYQEERVALFLVEETNRDGQQYQTRDALRYYKSGQRVEYSRTPLAERIGIVIDEAAYLLKTAWWSLTCTEVQRLRAVTVEESRKISRVAEVEALIEFIQYR